ncbi:spinster family MFS transporter [Euryhalocaulis caribicus]|uniref:spinster family MFS transporter n=1 Tax=Euryhalocaulis caribicus TaxID=1161401 RepID=UPI00039D5A24|nr:MFS transporter [Euryhalocaulis caribicus]
MSADTPQEAAETHPGAGFKPWYRNYVLLLLLLVYIFNFIDRQVIAILSPAIKADLGVSDTQLGLLKGLAFALLYSILGLPIARLADRRNRVNIVTISLTLWSVFTAMSGLAANFIQLAAARFAVGIGEAGCAPPSHSLISDYFSRKRRSTALAVFSMGIPLGVMFAFLAGGVLANALGWRWTFVAVGLPGLLLAVILKLTVKEPPRGASASGLEAAPPFMESIKLLLSLKSYVLLSVASAIASMSAFALATWVVDFYVRVHEIGFLQITTPLGFIIGGGMAAGIFIGGQLGDRFGPKDSRYYMWIPAAGFLLAFPLIMLAIYAETSLASFLWLAAGYILAGLYAGPVFASIQNLAPVRLRAFAVALFLLIVNIGGAGMGPLVAGILSDLMLAAHGPAEGLRLSLALTTLGFVVAAFIYWMASRTITEELAAAPDQDL